SVDDLNVPVRDRGEVAPKPLAADQLPGALRQAAEGLGGLPHCLVDAGEESESRFDPAFDTREQTLRRGALQLLDFGFQTEDEFRERLRCGRERGEFRAEFAGSAAAFFHRFALCLLSVRDSTGGFGDLQVGFVYLPLGFADFGVLLDSLATASRGFLVRPLLFEFRLFEALSGFFYPELEAPQFGTRMATRFCPSSIQFAPGIRKVFGSPFLSKAGIDGRVFQILKVPNSFLACQGEFMLSSLGPNLGLRELAFRTSDRFSGRFLSFGTLFRRFPRSNLRAVHFAENALDTAQGERTDAHCLRKGPKQRGIGHQSSRKGGKS